MTYTERFDKHTHGLAYLSVGGEEGDLGFSWRSCEGCNSPLAGDRYQAHALLVEHNEWTTLAVCTDCLLYIANGDVPEEEVA
jgi:hypothetical protein